jgi:hypothetical protein
MEGVMSAWTTVGTLLPDEEITVLLALDDGEVWPGYLSETGWMYVTGDPIERNRVTHWMHMPAHPDGLGAA